MLVNFRSRERAPDEVGGVKIPYLKTARGTGHKVAWYLVLLGVLSPILYLASGVAGSWLALTANGAVTLEPRQIRATESGFVAELPIRPGDRVERGETLAVLDSYELDAAAAHARLQLHASAAARDSARRERQAQLAEARSRQQALSYLQTRRLAIETLFREGAATAAELTSATYEVTEAQAALARAEAALASDGASADTDSADRELIARRLRSLTRRSPFGGRVLQVLVTPGEYVTAGEPLAVVASLDNPHVVAYVPPRYATRLEIGTAATLRFPDGTKLQASISALPGVTDRMPADMVDQFGLRPTAVVLDLLPATSWPDAERIQGLPVSVRFRYGWESTGPGRLLGKLLGWISG
jgi:multidrug resistance efflux pump